MSNRGLSLLLYILRLSVAIASTLARLARHYSVSGWERWQRSNSDDTDATAYEDLDGVVTAYPDKCLRFLATTWGLQYSGL